MHQKVLNFLFAGSRSIDQVLHCCYSSNGYLLLYKIFNKPFVAQDAIHEGIWIKWL